MKEMLCNEAKSLSEVGFEPTPTIVDQNSQLYFRASIALESGALDRSAILTCVTWVTLLIL